MESTQISFIQEKSLPIITFLGRLTDSKKGLSLFLEALEILASLSQLECFIVWIIGGDNHESEFVQKSLKSYSILYSKYEQGSLMLWGRVENDALPELLSRSSVLVMPSLREQFGMVAVEAMLCGCPVIASRVGGLNDLIIPQKTGFHFERGNSMALCAVLSGFLRNKPERKRMRIYAADWAQRFSQKKTFHAIKSLYDQQIDHIQDFWKLDYKDNNTVQLIEQAENLINKKIDSFKILHSHGKHFSIKIETKKRLFFVKKINKFPSCTISVIPTDFNQFPDPKSTKERFLRELYQLENPIAPQIVKHDFKNSILIMDYCKEIKKDIFNNPKVINEVIENVRSYKPILPSESIVIEYNKVLVEIEANPSLELINEFDRITSKINQRITKDLSTFTRFHPQVELHRLKLMLDQRVWQLPHLAKSIFLNTIHDVLKKVEFNYSLPTLAHGDLKSGHFLESDSTILLCDWEHSKYCTGPLDHAIIAFKRFYNREKTLRSAMLFLRKLLPNNEFKLNQATAWLIAQVIFSSIYWYTQGDENSILRGTNFLKGFS